MCLQKIWICDVEDTVRMKTSLKFTKKSEILCVVTFDPAVRFGKNIAIIKADNAYITMNDFGSL